MEADCRVNGVCFEVHRFVFDDELSKADCCMCVHLELHSLSLTVVKFKSSFLSK